MKLNPLKRRLFISMFVAGVILGLILLSSIRSSAPVDKPIASTDPGPLLANLPISFIENRGQVDERIDYYIQSPSHSMYFTKEGYALRLTEANIVDAKAHTIKVEFVDAHAESIEGLERSPGVVSYFKGNKEQWTTAIPTHRKIGYVQPWSGIDLTYDGADGRLESIYTIAPYADPGQIKLRYSGQSSLTLDDDGNLVYSTSLGDVKETAPVAWQDIEGHRVSVQTRFTLLDDSTVTFEIADYDPGHVLILDPTLVYAGFIGGSGSDIGQAIAVDGVGNTYVTGYTYSTAATFPVTVGPDLTQNGSSDAFVAKVNAAGTALVYAGYLGSSADDTAYGIAVDSEGNAYVTGGTTSSMSSSPSFPVIGGPDLTPNGNEDAFVAKVNPSGTALVYAGFIGGNRVDEGRAIAVDSARNAYVTGFTNSNSGFPVNGGLDDTFNGSIDAFVAKVNTNGTSLLHASYLGGSLNDHGYGIAVDGVGNAYVTGATFSSESTFPVVVGPDLTFSGGPEDAFVAKVNPAGNALVYAGYIGGSAAEFGRGIAVDTSGSVYVTGTTGSFGFPAATGPDVTYNGGFDAFVAKINPAGTSTVYAGFIGGSGIDEGYGIGLDNAGNAYVTGYTASTEATFPVTDGPDLTQNGGRDAFVAKVNPGGTELVYAGFIGGNGNDEANGMATDSSGNAYVVGQTVSSETSFPVVVGPDVTQNGASDAFVAKIAATAATTPTPTATPTATSTATPTATPTVTPTPAGFEGDVAPRPDGDGVALSTDITQLRRFVTGLDMPNPATNEAQRADCAPRASSGDGAITSGDVVQGRRYVTGLDPQTEAGGPVAPSLVPEVLATFIDEIYEYFVERKLQAGSVSGVAGQTVTIPIEITPYGDEVAAGFTLEYDAAKLNNPQVSLGEAAPAGSSLTVNLNEKGRIGILVDSTEAITASAMPKRIVMVTFDVAKDAANGDTPLLITGTLAPLGVSDESGKILTTSYRAGTVTITDTGFLKP